ncbi:MAG: hypothetical protein KAJ09_03835 [Deltaproteobacteria bacterium]|nr:hypothetical protein [Deltaproteobacteria bacterium]
MFVVKRPRWSLDWYYWEFWHHEGRRARHGASMSGPNYAWWHGLYDVAKNFYLHFIPEAEKVAGRKLAKEILGEHVYSREEHRWYKEGMTKEQLEKNPEILQETLRSIIGREREPRGGA